MDPRVQLVVKLLEAELTHTFSVANLCDRLHVSPSHLQHLFKRDVHMSIREFILRTRLRAAAVMIGTTRERIRQISFASGFRDISNFNHAFKRQFGVSPREYRMRSILAGELAEHAGNGGLNQ
jgi:transcriptional regulator GlxA family with amidase domain